MAKYIKQEMADLDGSGKQRVYYRMKTQGTLSGRDFIRKVAYTGSGLSEGNVMHVLAIVAKELVRDYLREHHVMRIADYMEITSLSRTRATVELQEFSSSPDSGITCRGRGAAKVYCLRT